MRRGHCRLNGVFPAFDLSKSLLSFANIVENSVCAMQQSTDNRLWKQTMATDTYLEELRFAKERQWAVAIATITFIAGAFHMAHTVKQPLVRWEQYAATILVSIVAIGGGGMLLQLQRHLRATRLVIDPNDPDPWRGRGTVYGLICVLGISAIAVCYSFWRA
jgi:hypothetical protein